MNAITKGLLRHFSRVGRPYLRTYGLLQTSKVFSRSALLWEPGAQRVAVLAPHMDDETIGCGGTLALHTASGGAVSVIYLTDGSGGGGVNGGAAAQLAGVRRNESEKALEILGVGGAHFLDGPDGQLEATPALVAALRRLLETIRPEVVYLPFFLEEHPDHRAASALLLAATENSAMNFACYGYEVWTPLFPNCFVPVDEVIHRKRAALQEYHSQLLSADYVHTQLGLNAYRSTALQGKEYRYAEAFCALPLQDYRELYASYVQQG